MLTIEADIYEYVRMSYVDKNILGPLVHMECVSGVHVHISKRVDIALWFTLTQW